MTLERVCLINLLRIKKSINFYNFVKIYFPFIIRASNTFSEIPVCSSQKTNYRNCQNLLTSGTSIVESSFQRMLSPAAQLVISNISVLICRNFQPSGEVCEFKLSNCVYCQQYIKIAVLLPIFKILSPLSLLQQEQKFIVNFGSCCHIYDRKLAH